MINKILSKIKFVTKGIIFGILSASLVVFIKEVYVYQILEIPVFWDSISLGQQTLININLGLMDLKVVFTVIALLVFIKWYWIGDD